MKRNSDLSSVAELYNPATGTFTATGSQHTFAAVQTATLLNNGLVLITGGNGANLASAELYNPATGTFSSTGSMAVARSAYTATLLGNGLVLILLGLAHVAWWNLQDRRIKRRTS